MTNPTLIERIDDWMINRRETSLRLLQDCREALSTPLPDDVAAIKGEWEVYKDDMKAAGFALDETAEIIAQKAIDMLERLWRRCENLEAMNEKISRWDAVKDLKQQQRIAELEAQNREYDEALNIAAGSASDEDEEHFIRRDLDRIRGMSG